MLRGTMPMERFPRLRLVSCSNYKNFLCYIVQKRAQFGELTALIDYE